MIDRLLQIAPRWIFLSIQVIILLYYQSIFGYIITLVLRIAIRFGLVRFVKRKKRNIISRCNNDEKNNEEDDDDDEGGEGTGESWEMHTNFRSLLRVIPSSSLFKLQYSKRRKRTVKRGRGEEQGNVDHENEQKQMKDDYIDDGGDGGDCILPQFISVVSTIPSCSIPTVKLSPLIRLKGVKGQHSTRRTYILGILLEQLQFQLNITLKIMEEDTNQPQKSENENSNGHNHNVDMEVKLGIGRIQLYLISQGLIPVMMRRFRKLFHKRNHGAGSTNTQREDTRQKMLLYFIPKLIGGIEIFDFQLSSSVQAASNILSQIHQYDITTNAKAIRITLQTKADRSDHAKEEQSKNDRVCSLSVEIQSFSANIINQCNNDHQSDCEDNIVQSIALEQVIFSLKLPEASPAKMQIHTYAKVEVAVSFEELVRLIQMTVVFIPIVLNATMGKTQKENSMMSQHESNARNQVIDLKKKQKFKLELLSVNAEVKLYVFDDRIETTSLFGEKSSPLIKKLEVYSKLSIERKESLNGMDLSVVVPTLKITSKKQMNMPGKLQLDLGDATFIIEKTPEDGENELFLDVNKLSFTSDCKFETEYLLGVALYIHTSVGDALQKKVTHELEQKSSKAKPKPPFKCFAVSCKNLTLGVHLPSLENQFHDVGILFNFLLTGVLVSISPPVNGDNGQSCIDGEANIEVATLIASVIFVPHQTLPNFGDCVDEVLSNEIAMKADPCLNAPTRTYTMSGNMVALDILLPSNDQLTTSHDCDEQLFVEFSIDAAKVVEDMNLNQEFCLLGSSHRIHFEIYKSMALDYFGKPLIVQNIYIDTNEGKLYLHWSPITQWFITSIVKQVVDIIKYYVIKPAEAHTQSPSQRHNMLTNVKISSNDTAIQVNATLGGTSFCDVCAENLLLDISHNTDSTWQKPNICCDIGELAVKLNNCTSALVRTSSFRFSDSFCRASSEEIETYWKKKQNNAEGEDAVVKGECGAPLLERFELTFGDITRVDMPPEAHLGMLIEDIVQTEKSVKEGLFVSGMIKRGTPPPQRRYQLMDIHFNIPMLDANFLENRPTKRYKSSKLHPDLIFGNDNNLSLLNRWRFHVKKLSVLIKRNTPPSITQGKLRDLDEDKSRKHRYGPVIQGGFFNLSIDHVMCVLHPLNMALPLGDIKNLTLSGLIYLASLHPETKGLGKKRKLCVPVKYHQSAEQSFHKYDYGVTLESDSAPAKIYYDVKLRSDDVHSNYGPILNQAIPALVQITQRFIPSPPFIDQRFDVRQDSPPPLTAWDNMRHQFHGKFSWKVKKVSFRWLLDTIRNYNWSLQLTTKDFHLYHSTGLFGLTLTDSIVTVPSLSYHLLNLKDRNHGFGLFPDNMDLQTGEGTFKRHSLLLLPSLHVKFKFQWKVPFPKVNHSSRHHTPFLIEDGGWPNCICPKDRFSNFRSRGVTMQFEIDVDRSDEFSTWIALRADVLPWLTHRLSNTQVENIEEMKGDDEEEEEELNIDGVQIEVNANDLHIAAWFDEQAEFQSNRNDTRKDIVEGLFLTIPQVFYMLDNVGRNRIDIDGVQAALLDVDYNDFAFPLSSQRHRQNWASKQWASFQHPCEYEESNNLNSFRMFTSLYIASQQTKSLDYLLLVDQINILDKSLEEILNGVDLDTTLHSFSEIGSEIKAIQKSAPWTVLVAKMKLLWTLEIRDRVIQIVKDILYSINLMRVNARGTPQLLGESDAKLTDEVCSGKSDQSTDAVLNTIEELENARGNLFLKDESHKTVTPVAAFKADTTFSTHESPEKMEPISHLDYLLHDSPDQDIFKDPSSQNIKGDEKTNLTKTTTEPIDESVTSISNSSSSDKIEKADTIPTFDLHLSNAQIQFHSEKTGGSVIISMLGAYIEMKMFLHLFCKEEDFKAEDFRVETLLRRTENLYTLYRMEVYSLSNSVDLDVGLQWLGTARLSEASSVDGHVESLRTQELMKFRERHCHDGIVFDKLERSFPSDLQAHDTKEFTLPPLCEKIMDPCTFTTLQTFHRPPIDLTIEELEETIKKKSISSLTTTDDDNRKSSRAIDHVELFIDELSFRLDSHQFSTTLDVIRNVLLEPLQPDRERFYNKNKPKSDTTKANPKTTKTDTDGKSEACTKMEDAIRQWDQQAHQKSKKGREYLRNIANDLLAEIEEKQGSEGPSIRRIGYTLCRATWRIASPDSINNAVVSFTRFKGVHDYTADGSVNSQITLEDFSVESTSPGSESIDFFDPTIIIKTISGAQRVPLLRPGNLLKISQTNSNSTIRSRIPAISVRMDALPRTVDGLTMYKHIEANVFPGVNHNIIVQLTKSLTKSFVNYFLGGGNKHGEFIDHDIVDSSSECSSQNRLRAGSDSSSEAFDVSNPSGNDMATARSSQNSKKPSNSDGKEKARRIMLFGRMRPNKKNKKKKSRNQDEDSIEIKPSVSTNTSIEEEENSNDAKQAGEIVFVKLWRLGPINIDLSIAGFGRIVNLTNQGVLVPDFRKAYKIGASNHLIKKVVKHFVASLFSNGLDILRNKLGGNKSHMKSPATADDFNVGLTRGRVLSDLDEGNESEEEDKAAIKLLTNHSGNPRKRLYTK